MQNLQIDDYSVTVNIYLNDKPDIYTTSDTIQTNLIQISDAFFLGLGANFQASITAGLGQSLQTLLLLKLFLDEIVFSAVFILGLLSCILIYSLMLSNVEEKTYEFGMLRALGFEKRSLLVMLLQESLIFSLPGLGFGFMFSYVVNSLVAMFIFDSTQLVSSYGYSSDTLTLGFLLGIFIPIISNILPLRRALSKSLRDSLDRFHRSTNEITISVQKLEQYGISAYSALTALFLILIGVTCYYLAPYAFLFLNFSLLLFIFNCLLIVMMLGMILLVNMVQLPLEKLLLHLSLWISKRDKKLKVVIIKNMEGHRRRNGKTALMFTMTLAFLLLAGTGFALQGQVVTDVLKQVIGSDFAVLQIGQSSLVGIDEAGLSKFVDQYRATNPNVIQDYTFISYGLYRFPLFDGKN